MAGRARKRFPTDAEFFPDSSEDTSKIRRVKLSEVSAAGWLLSALTLMISLTLILYVVLPLLGGYATPWDLMQGARFQVEGNVIMLSAIIVEWAANLSGRYTCQRVITFFAWYLHSPIRNLCSYSLRL
jgi:hypothetical protein